MGHIPDVNSPQNLEVKCLYGKPCSLPSCISVNAPHGEPAPGGLAWEPVRKCPYLSIQIKK